MRRSGKQLGLRKGKDASAARSGSCYNKIRMYGNHVDGLNTVWTARKRKVRKTVNGEKSRSVKDGK